MKVSINACEEKKWRLLLERRIGNREVAEHESDMEGREGMK